MKFSVRLSIFIKTRSQTHRIAEAHTQKLGFKQFAVHMIETSKQPVNAGNPEKDSKKCHKDPVNGFRR